MKKRVMLILGTRPEAIKMAPVVLELRRRAQVKAQVCITAQHRGLLDDALKSFGVRPDFDLNLMRAHQSLQDVACGILQKLPTILRREKPDWVCVHGDTQTALYSALCAFYAKIPIAHVEAGLRTHDLSQPFPEESNRKLIDAIAALHFAPTSVARQNLLREGVAAKSIHVTGNTAIDALKLVRSGPTQISSAFAGVLSQAQRATSFLVTVHRRENWGAPLRNIVLAFKRLAQKHPQLKFFCPLHPNPEAGAMLRREWKRVPQAVLLPPLPYAELLELLSKVKIVLTDSGGLQEESPYFGKPVVVLREVTERPELISAHAGLLVGARPDKIFSACEKLLRPATYASFARKRALFGDGRAAERIATVLQK